MADAWDWRDHFEEFDRDGNTVVYVNEKKYRSCRGETYEFAYLRKEDHQLFMTTDGDLLVPKQKPKTYRPYEREELKCGMVFRNKSNGVDYMVVRIGCSYVALGGDNDNATAFSELLDRFVQSDGSPAGVLE